MAPAAAPSIMSESAAKLPPPGEPEMAGHAVIASPVAQKTEIGPGLEIEKFDSTVSETARLGATREGGPSAKSEAARKLRIKNEEERLNHNALVWQESRAAQGSAVAMRSLAFRYLKGDGVEKDEAKGLAMMRKAAEAGDPAAKREIAKIDAPKAISK